LCVCFELVNFVVLVGDNNNGEFQLIRLARDTNLKM